MQEELIKNLKEMPSLIKDKAQELINKRNAKDELQLLIKTTETETLMNIENEYAETKNKDLSNISKRQAEMDKRLIDNASYQTQKQILKDHEKEIQELYLNIEFINNKFKAQRSIAYLLGGN